MKDKIKERIDKLGEIEIVPKKDKPSKIIEDIDYSFLIATKGRHYTEDLFIVLHKWINETLCILNARDLYDYGFAHKKNSNNELIKTISPNEALVVNFVIGEIKSYNAHTGNYTFLKKVDNLVDFGKFLIPYEKNVV